MVIVKAVRGVHHLQRHAQNAFYVNMTISTEMSGCQLLVIHREIASK